MSEKSYRANFQGIHRTDGLLDVEPLDKEKFKEQLAAGNIPENLRDEWGLVNENTELARQFQTTMERITQKLLYDAGERIDVRSLGIRFMLCHDKHPNAGIVLDAALPIMMFTNSLLQKLRTLDQLEAVIGHELGHKVFRDKLGQHKNSKGEEIASDGYGTYLLFKAKRNVEASKEVLELLRTEGSTIDRWAGYVDPHPNDGMRIRLLENAYEGLKEVYGGYSTASTSADEEIAQYRQFEYDTIFKQELTAIGYYQFSTEEKVDWLIKQIPIAENWAGHDYVKRSREFEDLLNDVTYECRRGSFSDDVASIEKHSAALSRLQQAAVNSKSFRFFAAIYLPYEPFERLREAAKAFVNSTTVEVTAKAASEIIAVLRDRPYPLQQDFVVHGLNIHGFDFPAKGEVEKAEIKIIEDFIKEANSNTDHEKLYADLCEKHGVLVPWNNQIRHYQETGNEEIATVARLFKVYDQRLPKLTPNPNIPELASEKLGWTTKEDLAHPQLAEMRMHYRMNPVYKLKITDSGKIVGLNANNIQLSFGESDPIKALSYEQFRILQENTAQGAAIRNTDFTEMENSFWGFANKNKIHLKPIATFKNVEFNHQFADKFTQTLSELIKKDPAKFIPLAYEFFAGRSSVTREPILRENPENKTTLPILLEENITGRMANSKVPFGVSMTHPYFRFMLNDQFNIFSDENRLVVMQHANFVKKAYMPGDRVEDVLEPEIIAFHSNVPSTYDEIVKTCEDYIEPFKKAMESGKENFTLEFTEQSAGKKFLAASEITLLQANLYQAVRNKRTPYSLSDLKRLNSLFDDYGSDVFGDKEEAYAAILETNKLLDFSADITADDLLEKYDFYITNKYLVSNPTARREYQAKIIERSNELTNASASVSREILKTHPFTSPAFDKLLIQHWNANLKGKDNNAAAITKDLLADDVPITRVHDMMAQFAENNQLQPAECYEIERQLQGAGLSQLPASHLKAVTAELIIDLVSEDAEVRQQLLDYLSNNETPASTKKTVDMIDKSAREKSKSWNIKGINSAQITQTQKEDAIALMHENYCSWPIQWQAVYLEKILFPVNNKLAEKAGVNVTIQSETELVLNKCFPPDKANSKVTRDFIECYLQQHTEAGQRLVLAVVMAASREGEFDNLENISQMRQAGRTVGRILCKQHPLGAKFAQEIESYTGTDPEFRRGLQDVDVKAGVDLGPRWDTMHLLEAATKDHPEVLNGKKVGKVLGGGSVQINVQVADEAVALLRDNVNVRAERQHKMFGGTLDAFAKCNPDFIGLNEILESSYHNLKIETDYSLAPIQAANAQEIYNDGVIEVDGRKVVFAAVDFRGCSDKFKRYSLAEGTHFNDLPVNTPEERSIKKAAAKAIITRELTAMMRGQAIDSDRHGKQQKIQIINGTILITNFDDGAVAINPPSVG